MSLNATITSSFSSSRGLHGINKNTALLLLPTINFYACGVPKIRAIPAGRREEHFAGLVAFQAVTNSVALLLVLLLQLGAGEKSQSYSSLNFEDHSARSLQYTMAPFLVCLHSTTTMNQSSLSPTQRYQGNMLEKNLLLGLEETADACPGYQRDIDVERECGYSIGLRQLYRAIMTSASAVFHLKANLALGESRRADN